MTCIYYRCCSPHIPEACVTTMQQRTTYARVTNCNYSTPCVYVSVSYEYVRVRRAYVRVRRAYVRVCHVYIRVRGAYIRCGLRTSECSVRTQRWRGSVG